MTTTSPRKTMIQNTTIHDSKKDDREWGWSTKQKNVADRWCHALVKQHQIGNNPSTAWLVSEQFWTATHRYMRWYLLLELYLYGVDYFFYLAFEIHGWPFIFSTSTAWSKNDMAPGIPPYFACGKPQLLGWKLRSMQLWLLTRVRVPTCMWKWAL